MAQAQEETHINMVYMLKWITAAVVAWWGSVPVTVQSLAALMVIDYIAGVLRAKKQNRCCWDQARNGLIDKALVMLLMLACYSISKASNLPINIGSGLAVPFCVTEFYSIARNCREAGLKVPAAVLDILARARDNKPTKRKRTK